ncbi:hypothetical protein L21SP2_2909 [Salinispira pacifica]|uniref:Uncharacterized protein n=1 Tax=Salinispira pacifica TaxID=1307761 RepID=V5WKT3_9SPIO|nr:hypothetical protein L21SP2_2909 [Salinispira pacifica]
MSATHIGRTSCAAKSHFTDPLPRLLNSIIAPRCLCNFVFHFNISVNPHEVTLKVTSRQY